MKTSIPRHRRSLVAPIQVLKHQPLSPDIFDTIAEHCDQDTLTTLMRVSRLAYKRAGVLLYTDAELPLLETGQLLFGEPMTTTPIRLDSTVLGFEAFYRRYSEDIQTTHTMVAPRLSMEHEYWQHLWPLTKHDFYETYAHQFLRGMDRLSLCLAYPRLKNFSSRCTYYLEGIMATLAHLPNLQRLRLDGYVFVWPLEGYLPGTVAAPPGFAVMPPTLKKIEMVNVYMVGQEGILWSYDAAPPTHLQELVFVSAFKKASGSPMTSSLISQITCLHQLTRLVLGVKWAGNLRLGRLLTSLPLLRSLQVRGLTLSNTLGNPPVLGHYDDIKELMCGSHRQLRRLRISVSSLTFTESVAPLVPYKFKLHESRDRWPLLHYLRIKFEWDDGTRRVVWNGK